MTYDLLLERAIEAVQGAPPDVVIEDGHVGLIDAARRTTLVKLHGCLTLPETIVLTRDDYETYADRHRALVAYLQWLLATRTFLFVGFGLGDPNFRAIYSTIARALGPYQRRAYLLEGAQRPEPLVRYWRQQGVVTLELDGYDQGPAFVRGIADAVGATRSVMAAAHVLNRLEPPPMHVEPLLGQLEGLRATLAEVIAQARDTRLLPQQDEPPVEAPDPAATDGSDTRAWVRRKARALLELATAIDGAVPLDDPLQWVSLGDLLYEQGDASGAVRAYQAALRPTVDSAQLRRHIIRRVRGNLARALAHEGHHARAEWLLRRCVYRDEEDAARDAADRWGVYQRLDLEGLRERPTDAAELGHAITRRVERLRADGHPVEAFAALRAVRYVLEPLLGIRRRPGGPPAEDLFGAELVQLNVQRTWRTRGQRESDIAPIRQTRSRSTSFDNIVSKR